MRDPPMIPAAARPPAAAPVRDPGPALGLSEEAARAALAAVGPNMLEQGEGPHWLLRLGRNFTHLFAVLLWGGSVLALVGGMPELSAAIVAVIIVNAFFSFAQEYRAERAVDALKRILPQRVRVRRSGHLREIDAQEVVPGDVVLLAAGDRVPADAQLLVESGLEVDMSTLTGESRPCDGT
jgi:magnesium-transporting ATPase (P-type)